MNRRPRILVVGSYVMDQIAETEVFPREGQTVLGSTFHKAPGGKGANQAMQAAKLGADVTMIGKLGRDSNGDEMRAAMDKAGIHTDKTLYSDSCASGCSLIILEKKADGTVQNRIIVISGSNLDIQKEEVSFLEEEVANYDLVMLQLEIPMEINELVASYAAAKGVPVMLNSAPSAPLSPSFLKNLTFISPNETEAEDLTGVHINHEGTSFDRAAAEKALSILKEKGVKNVLITMGSAGAILQTEDGRLIHSACIKTDVKDPTAAGDSFVGAFCTGYCCGWNYEEILSFANHVASITVSRMGAIPSLPTIDEVEKSYQMRKEESPETAALHA